MLKLEYIVENNGDSILEGYMYSEGALIIKIALSDIDQKVLIKIRTDSMSFKNHYLEKTEELYRTCRIEIQELSTVLAIENGVYAPSHTFGKRMNEKRSNYHLAYGEKTNVVKYIFSLVGYDRLISCLVANLDCIKLEELS